jgi:endonuclease/exonuclease/phosphatase family metal-dependent hydrolase
MAKHAGERSRRRPPALPRGAAWGLGAFLLVGALTVVAVARGVAGHDTADLSATTSGAGNQAQTQARERQPQGHPSEKQAQRTAQSTATRRPDLSRHAVRPSVAPYHVKSGPTLTLKPTVVLARKVADLSPASSTFTIAQSNILGSNHTMGKNSGFAPGTVRAGMTASLLMSRGVDVGGMQEVQQDQLRVLQGRMAGYSIWPAAALGHNGIRNQIYWRDSQFEMKDSGSVTYTFSNQRIPLPYVLLRDRGTGAEFWVISTHNSAGNMESQRDSGTTTEISLIHTLMAKGQPVVIVGDMNEHTEFFCRVSAATGMVAANGGSGAGGCHLPPNPLRVDWIMGGHGMSFSGYRQDGAGLGRVSDHYYLYATATATSQWYAP